MAKLSRVCPHCGEQGELESAFCASCGESNSPDTAQRSANRSIDESDKVGSLPIQLRKAALPLLAGAAGLIVQVGWRLLQSKTARDVALNAANSALQSRVQTHMAKGHAPIEPSAATHPVSRQSGSVVARRQGRTIRIRSSWAVGDASGVLRQGQSEHTIEIDD